ncbi:MAG: hypothetical protein GY795_21030 [Desulfobacterales bacterium]|nr:hypothetical protein [Desulfobacterales bacterium]
MNSSVHIIFFLAFYCTALYLSKYLNKNFPVFEDLRGFGNPAGLLKACFVNGVSAFSRINDVYAKEMVLYLSKERHRFVGRKELKQKLGLEMSDIELEKKFKALVQGRYH